MKTALIAFLLVAISGTSFVLYQRDTKTDLPALRTAAVERGDMQFTVDATGTVEPEEVVDVGAQVAGRIESLGPDPRNPSDSIDYGSPVDVGTVLAHIDDSLYQSDVLQAKAQVASAQAIAESTASQVLEADANIERAQKDLLQMQAKLFQAERDWKRAEKLSKSSPGAISESDLDLAKSTYEAADAAVGVANAAIAQAKAQLAIAKSTVVKTQADVGQAQANLTRSQTNLSYCTIKSPVAGVIIDRRINVGQTVVSSLNTPSLFLIAKDLKRLQVWASVNEADIGNIKSGQKVEFTVDAFPGQTFEGVVAADQPRLNASMTQNVVTYTVVVDTDNSSGRLIPYLTADVGFQVAQHNDVLMVPNTALRWRPSSDRLAAAGKDATNDGADAGADAVTSEPSLKPGATGTVWVLENDQLRPVNVREVLNDGTRTEVVADGLQPGARVVIGEAAAAAGSESTDPFLPKMFGSGRRQQQ